MPCKLGSCGIRAMSVKRYLDQLVSGWCFVWEILENNIPFWIPIEAVVGAHSDFPDDIFLTFRIS